MATGSKKPPDEPPSPEWEPESRPIIIGSMRAPRSSASVVELEPTYRRPDPRRDEAADDPISTTRSRLAPDPGLTALLADFLARATGLFGSELEAEISRFVDVVVERDLASVPPDLRPLVLDHARELVLADPAVATALRALRGSVAHGQ